MWGYSYIYTNMELDIMNKYLIRYLIFWAPAVLSAYFLAHFGGIMQVAQWFFGFFMLFGWAINSGMAAYSYPRVTLAFILTYIGVNALLIAALVRQPFGSVGYRILDHVAGAFTYRPLYMFYQALEFSFREMWVAGIVAGACMLGLICGALNRQVKPDPFRPRFIR